MKDSLGDIFVRCQYSVLFLLTIGSDLHRLAGQHPNRGGPSQFGDVGSEVIICESLDDPPPRPGDPTSVTVSSVKTYLSQS